MGTGRTQECVVKGVCKIQEYIIDVRIVCGVCVGVCVFLFLYLICFVCVFLKYVSFQETFYTLSDCFEESWMVSDFFSLTVIHVVWWYSLKSNLN